MHTLLIVDDDVMLGHMVTQVFRTAGYRVVRAYTGPEALATLHYIVVDLVICDVMLPEVNGDQVVAMMQSHPRLTTIPVVMTSALPVAMYPQVHATTWVQKPYRWATLQETVRTILATPPVGDAISDSGLTRE